MAKKQILTVDLPKEIDASDIKSIGLDIITHIQERAINENKGYDPKTKSTYRFPEYSEAYATRKGSSVRDVNLILSGDMFSAMDVTKIQPRAKRVEVGFVDSDMNDRAFYNQTGSYNGKPNKEKARYFMGVTKKELDEILSKYLPEPETSEE